jgi:pilus assembly protein Flp/PilA
MTKFHKILADRRGATAVEYALIASLLSVAAIVGYETLGQKVEGSFNETAEKVIGAGG